MQIQMTERDKKLIVFLAIFVIVVAGGYWGIYPIVTKIITTNMELQDAQIERDKNEIKIAQLSLIEMENENLEAEIVDAREDFFPIMTSDQVDKYMTGLILDYNLYAYDLSISMPTDEATVEPYQYSEKAIRLEEESDSASGSDRENSNEDSSNGTDGNEDNSKTVSDWNSMEEVETGIYAVSITMRVGGDRADIQQLIDDLSTTEQKLHLNSYSWGTERSVTYNEDRTYEVNTNQTMTMSLNIYMCEEQGWK